MLIVSRPAGPSWNTRDPQIAQADPAGSHADQNLARPRARATPRARSSTACGSCAERPPSSCPTYRDCPAGSWILKKTMALSRPAGSTGLGIDRVGQFAECDEMIIRFGHLRRNLRSPEAFQALAALDPADGVS